MKNSEFKSLPNNRRGRFVYVYGKHLYRNGKTNDKIYKWRKSPKIGCRLNPGDVVLVRPKTADQYGKYHPQPVVVTSVEICDRPDMSVTGVVFKRVKRGTTE